MLARHEYAAAKAKALALNHQALDDVMTYGYLAEADIALGEYKDAETSAQWQMNLRPSNIPALITGAKLRVLFGQSDGAIAFLNLAYAETSPIELEEQAWIANQIAAIQIDTGKTDAAAQVLEDASKLYPNYATTLENLARVRLAQHRPADALTLLQRASQMDHDPHVLYLLSAAQSAAGNHSESQATSAQFERLASQAANGPTSASDDAVRDLILTFATTADRSRLTQALAIAQHQVSLRHDSWTLDAYAWALYANGRYAEADAAMQQALAVGIQSAQIFDHAGHIAAKLAHASDAARYFDLSLRSNPTSDFASDARQALGLAKDALQPMLQASNASPSQPQAAAPSSTTAAPALTEFVTRNTDPSFAPVVADLLIPHATGTDRRIQSAQALIAKNPVSPSAYTALGSAHFQRARETGDVSDYQLAEESLTKSLSLDATDFSAGDAFGSMAEVCMGEHRFADALTYSHKALALGSGDVSPFAIIGDAYADMGEYDKAAEAYARLTPHDMTLAPRAAYARDSRISYLSFIDGDTEAAIRLMKVAVAEGVEAQLPAENLAWLYYELGEYHTQAGDAAAADSAYLTALSIHPGDYRALAALAKLRANHGRYDEAIELYQKAIAIVPMPMFVAELGDVYTRAGNAAEAKKQYQLVEYIGLLGHINQVLHNRDLAFFYAEHGIKLPEALALAQKELEVRHDVYTWDTLAWALYKNGRYTEAVQASAKALHYGTRDSVLLFHAGIIAQHSGQSDQARTQLQQALAINPHFHLTYAQAAQQALASIDSQSASGEKHGR